MSHNSREQEYNTFHNLLTEIESTKYRVHGEITDKLYQNEFRQTYRLKIDKIDTTSTSKNIDSKANIGIFVDIPKNLDIHTGDRISFQGKITSHFKDENIDNLEGFQKYAWLHRIYGKSPINTFTKEAQEKNNYFQTFHDSIKNLIFKNFPRENAALILGISIGNTDFMNKELKEDFKNSGLTHILVVSGANIAFVILIISFILQFTPLHKYLKTCIVIGFILAYSHLVGWDMPVIRASIMGIISYLAISNSYKLHSISILLAIGCMLLLCEPLLLLYDASFGLSFGATFGILLFNSPLEKFFKKYISINAIVTIISVTLSATIGSLGALIYHFGSVSLLGILANILIGGIMGGLLIGSTIYIGLGYFVPDTILYYIGIPLYYITEYILFIGKAFGQFEPIEISNQIKIPLSILFYLAGFLYMLHQDENGRITNEINHRQ